MNIPRLSSALIFGILVIGWLLVWLGHAYVVPHLKLPLLIGLADPAVHGLVSLLLVLPLWLRRVVDTPVAIMAVLAGVLIDVDHAIAAGSFDFKAMLSLPGRPLGHSFVVSTLVAAGLALVLRLGWRRYASELPFYLFWVSLASHIARDGVTPWAWPWAAPAIPAAVFFGVFVPLSVGHWWLAERLHRNCHADEGSILARQSE